MRYFPLPVAYHTIAMFPSLPFAFPSVALHDISFSPHRSPQPKPPARPRDQSAVVYARLRTRHSPPQPILSPCKSSKRRPPRIPQTYKMTLDNDSTRKEQSQHLKILSETFLVHFYASDPLPSARPPTFLNLLVIQPLNLSGKNTFLAPPIDDISASGT